MDTSKTQTGGRQKLIFVSVAQNKFFFISGILILFTWAFFCWQGLVSVVDIWYGNEIFNHGFFIVPGAIYLIYLKRHTLLTQPIQTSPLALTIIIPSLLLYVVGIAGDIQLFLHVATFVLLPALFWLVLGTKAATTILFPLVFMLFSIPVGEQLIPYLQEIAADGSVALLHLTGVPLFRSGLYIEIPQGRFLVAEACSGVSFFIASFVIGSLYSYLNLQSIKRRVFFIVISLIFPVLANIVRVYGIILIAYWTDMEHAAGADHLIYGWFFFAFVILCLLSIGEFIKEQALEQNTKNETITVKKVHTSIIAITLMAFLFSFVWKNSISGTRGELIESDSFLRSNNDEGCSTISWSPIIVNPDVKEEAYLQGLECRVKVYTAWFSENDNELVSDLHRIYDPEQFSLANTSNIRTRGLTFSVYHVVTSNGEKLSIVRWYNIGDTQFSSSAKTKMYQVKNVLLGEGRSGRMWVLAVKGHDVLATSNSLTNVLNRIEG